MSTQLCCPWCKVQGIRHIGSYPINKRLTITYCRACQVIRGVIPLIGGSPSTPDETPLRCPWCNTAGIGQIKIAAAGKGWRVISCRDCGAIHGLTPIVAAKPAVQPIKQPRSPQRDVPARSEPAVDASAVSPSDPFGNTRLLAEIGNADLEARKAQYEFEINRRAMMGRRGGTFYRVIALDDGPPHCLPCGRDMEPHVVPPGYKNSGEKVWLCPNRCGAWEAG